MKKEIKLLLVLFISAFILNFAWENLHFPLYAGNNIGISSKLGLMLYASSIDLFWILAVYLLIAAIDKKLKWELNKTNLILFSILLITIAMFIEKFALSTGRWVYSSSMPIIFGIGLSPLIQLAITGLLSLFSSRFFSRFLSQFRKNKNIKNFKNT